MQSVKTGLYCLALGVGLEQLNLRYFQESDWNTKPYLICIAEEAYRCREQTGVHR